MMNEGSSVPTVPIGGKSETLYDKLNNLNAEISEGIFNLKGGRREEVQREIDDLRDASFRERSPEAVYSILLFRKYAETANQIKDSSQPHVQVSQQHGSRTGTGSLGLIGELPAFMYEAEDERRFVGIDATKTTTFRLRVFAVLFSILTLGVISATPYITEADFDPFDNFSKSHYKDCSVQKIQGTFNFRPYQLVLAIAVLALVHNCLFVVYYWLPVNDATGNKYVPGLGLLLGTCFRDAARGEELSARFSMFCRANARYVECAIDGLLLVLSFVAFVTSLWVLQLPVEFDVTEKNGDKLTEYYTLSTCYLTYDEDNCLEVLGNPSQFISAALAMLFFLIMVMLVSFLTSLRYIRQQLPPEASIGNLFTLLSSGGSVSESGSGGGADTATGTHSPAVTGLNSGVTTVGAASSVGSGGGGGGGIGGMFSSTGRMNRGLASQAVTISNNDEEEEVEVKL